MGTPSEQTHVIGDGRKKGQEPQARLSTLPDNFLVCRQGWQPRWGEAKMKIWVTPADTGRRHVPGRLPEASSPKNPPEVVHVPNVSSVPNLLSPITLHPAIFILFPLFFIGQTAEGGRPIRQTSERPLYLLHSTSVVDVPVLEAACPSSLSRHT